MSTQRDGEARQMGTQRGFMGKVVIPVVVLAVLGGLGRQIYIKVSGARGPGGGGPRGRGGVAVAVETAPVHRATVRKIGRFTGSLSPRSRFVVAPKVAGRLEKLVVDVGDPVKPGQLVAELDDGEYAQQVEQARAELAVAEANVAECRSALDVAGRELERVKKLRQTQVASEVELDEAQARQTACDAKHKVALAEVTRREAALKVAQVRLSYTRIRASWGDGGEPRVVGERFADQGAMLRANDPIVSILDNSVVVAVIDVIERDYPGVRPGQQAVMECDAYPGREFAGRIVRIAPLLKETSRQARVEIEVPNPERLLKPGMFIRARIEFDRHENATVVPVAALARRDGRQGVFLVDAQEKKARFVPVTLGILDGELAEVVEPPLSGQVVTMGHHLLEDGAAIRLPEETPAGTEKPRPSREGGARPGVRR